MLREQRKAINESLDAAFRFLRWAGIIVLVVIACSGVTFVKPDEAAMVLRFGKLAGATPADQVHGPGILIAWPYLIDEVVRVPVKRVQEVQVTLFSGQALPSATDEEEDEPKVGTLDPRTVGYCLTGDENIVHADALVKYQISDPIAYALLTQDPEAVVNEAVCEALTQAIGCAGVDSVLAEGKKALATCVMLRAQERLDQTGVGVALAAVEFREIRPPDAVAPEFEAVISAYVEKETKVRESRTYREREVPQAQADRDRMISDAEAFAADRLGRARGEVSTFRNVLAEYRENPKVVRERLYREATEKIVGGVGACTLVPQTGRGTTVLIPSESAPLKKKP